MRADEFFGFYSRRHECLLQIVERAMGKTIERGVDEKGLDAESYCEDEVDTN